VAKKLQQSLMSKMLGYQTSFPPHFSDKTTSVAKVAQTKPTSFYLTGK
jgi:hypothetical protein